MACITQYCGGGMQFAPLATGHSGALEFIDINDMSLLRRVMSLPVLGNGQINQHPEVFYARIEELTLSSNNPEIYFQCDGELIFNLPIQVTCLAEAFNTVRFS